jgi:DNA polymerase elongation subunit (family B)
MKLVNIGNFKRLVYLFVREDDGTLSIKEDNGFYPYFYEPDPNGKFLSFDGKPLRKVFVPFPADISRMRSEESYESDMLFTKRYVIDKVKTYDRAKLHWGMIDIEVVSPHGVPDIHTVNDTVAGAVIYDNFTEKYSEFYLEDFMSNNRSMAVAEMDMLNAIMDFLKEKKFDMILGWNFCSTGVRSRGRVSEGFDYPYLFRRTQRILQDNFARRISPVNSVRPADRDNNDLWLPIGTSVLDYLEMYRKANPREGVYSLDKVAQRRLKETPYKETAFGVLSRDLIVKCNNDVRRMVEIEKQCKLIPFYDSIRRITKVFWEDLYHNSRAIDMLFFEEGREKGVALPKRKYENAPEEINEELIGGESDETPKEEKKKKFQGATRDLNETGYFKNVGKYDLSGAYPTIIKEFCLDSVNIVEAPGENIVEIPILDRVTKEAMYTYYFVQNKNALLPAIAEKLLKLKADFGKEKDLASSKSKEEYEEAKHKYDAIKTVVNSCYGVMGSSYFRMYDKRVAETTTFLIRDLLMYVKTKLEEEQKVKILYWDTDSIFINSDFNYHDIMNQYIQDWAAQFGKKSIDLKFAYEGIFTKLFLMKKCRYRGMLLKVGKDKVEDETKGIEMKRNDSSKFCQKFQEALTDMIFDDKGEEEIVTWVKGEQERIKTLPILDVAFPCKINKSYTKNIPVFVKALNNTRRFVNDFNKNPGDGFYYIYVKPIVLELGTETKYYCGINRVTSEQVEAAKKGSNITVGKKELDSATFLSRLREKQVPLTESLNVLALDDYTTDHIKEIDWDKMISRNILNKAKAVFESMHWDIAKIGGVADEEGEE